MSDMLLESELRPFTVDEFHRMAESGIFRDGERVELIDGLLVTMPPIGNPHWTRHGSIVAYLLRALEGRALVFGQAALRLSERSEPQPDVAVLAPRADGYARHDPSTSDILALIELADSSLAKDRGRKLRLYARARVPDYLLVDLAADALSHFTQPSDLGYAGERVLQHGDRFSLSRIADVALSADPFLA